ncbi:MULTISPECIES: ECF transporter S component [Tepidanaerobacter]|uniref:Riboflavin transporter n=1 Tax=Tepidanaerobacter syntrophicus TaxID=224999 RepID=A0A0U9HE16_9FIRM|nr:MULTISPECIES: ECF transporter S component [Tepidanaerobacter]GAQ24742.1 riboflavin transporter FmnP [Tepidanaerobacter syntrophicus]GLI18988.1 riboflavin transporter [Tepidanaerobacter syntrophicus]GLI51138.1 riboflavin transporter [Tepidanaerobacter syntrophicus]HHV83861.1 ECF transporter S component [Tepidanaerobacter syntrophicus]
MRKSEVNKMSRLAMLAALSILLMFLVRFPLIPAAPFLEYEPGDIPALIAAFLFGPAAGVLVTLAVSIIQAFTVSAGSGWIGAIMHFIATGTMVAVAGYIYKKIHTQKGAVIALIAASISMTLVMIPLNLIFTTKFMNVPMEAVKAMIVPIIIPFNLLKASINSTLTFLVYKPIGRVLRVELEPVKPVKSAMEETR